jgi:hypothetical protein
VQLGISQVRYFGRVKTNFQLLLAATVANLALVAAKTGTMKRVGHQATLFLASLSRHAFLFTGFIITGFEQFLVRIRLSEKSTWTKTLRR